MSEICCGLRLNPAVDARLISCWEPAVCLTAVRNVRLETQNDQGYFIVCGTATNMEIQWNSITEFYMKIEKFAMSFFHNFIYREFETIQVQLLRTQKYPLISATTLSIPHGRTNFISSLFKIMPSLYFNLSYIVSVQHWSLLLTQIKPCFYAFIAKQQNQINNLLLLLYSLSAGFQISFEIRPHCKHGTNP